MAGRPKMMARKVADLELVSALLAVRVFETAPARYREDEMGQFCVPTIVDHAGYRRERRGRENVYLPTRDDQPAYHDPVERAWLAVCILASGLSLELQQLGDLLRRKAGMGGPGPVEELLDLPDEANGRRCAGLAGLDFAEARERLAGRMGPDPAGQNRDGADAPAQAEPAGET